MGHGLDQLEDALLADDTSDEADHPMLCTKSEISSQVQVLRPGSELFYLNTVPDPQDTFLRRDSDSYGRFCILAALRKDQICISSKPTFDPDDRRPNNTWTAFVKLEAMRGVKDHRNLSQLSCNPSNDLRERSMNVDDLISSKFDQAIYLNEGQCMTQCEQLSLERNRMNDKAQGPQCSCMTSIG